MESDKAMVVFEEKSIRRIWHEGGWYFSVVDAVGALTESANPRDYWYQLKKREFESTGIELSTFCRQLKIPSADGKKYETDCADTESMFRIIQSIPSKKAEPFKRWLASVGYERIQEIENPELAQDRAKEYYELKGYPKDWIEKRLRSIAIRQELTGEWKNRGITDAKDYAILTNEISEATFGIPIREHKKIKSLHPENKNQNLRDHMTDLELIFNMLGEASTTEIAKNKDAQGLDQNKGAVRKGGNIAGNARKKLEKETGRRIVSRKNYLPKNEEKRLEE